VGDSIRIREFEPTDREYEAVAHINALGEKDELLDFEPCSGAELRELDGSLDPSRYTLRRYVAEDTVSGTLAGYAFYAHTPWAFDPKVFWASVRCDPSYRRRGIGRELYTKVVDDLARIGATRVLMEATEGDEAVIAALVRRGFREQMRSTEYILKTSDARLEDFRRYDERVEAAGIEIFALPALAERDPGWLPKLHALHNDVMRDIPLPDEIDPFRPLPAFQEYLCGLPEALPDACFVAARGERYVGECVLHRSQVDPGCLDHLITGIDRAYRGSGVAIALKLRTIEYARSKGYERISTWVESNNPGMVEINRRFGFVRGGGLIIFEKEISKSG
jgi:mycothiol synthase